MQCSGEKNYNCWRDRLFYRHGLENDSTNISIYPCIVKSGSLVVPFLFEVNLAKKICDLCKNVKRNVKLCLFWVRKLIPKAQLAEGLSGFVWVISFNEQKLGSHQFHAIIELPKKPPQSCGHSVIQLEVLLEDRWPIMTNVIPIPSDPNPNPTPSIHPYLHKWINLTGLICRLDNLLKIS